MGEGRIGIGTESGGGRLLLISMRRTHVRTAAATTAADMECIVDVEQLRLYVFSSALCLVSKIKK